MVHTELSFLTGINKVFDKSKHESHRTVCKRVELQAESSCQNSRKHRSDFTGDFEDMIYKTGALCAGKSQCLLW